MFFCFEGIDGCGKSTQLKRIQKALESSGLQTHTVRDPGGPESSEEIRQVLLKPRPEGLDSLSELLLYNAARRELITQSIQPAIDAGKVVLSDRFYWSTRAYQGYGRGLDLNTIADLDNITCNDAQPRHTWVLDIPVAVFRERAEAAGRTADRMEQEKEEFFEKVRQGYLELARQYPERLSVIDGTQDPDAITQEITASLKDYLEE